MRSRYTDIRVEVSLQELQLLWACKQRRDGDVALPGLLDEAFCGAVYPSFMVSKHTKANQLLSC